MHSGLIEFQFDMLKKGFSALNDQYNIEKVKNHVF